MTRIIHGDANHPAVKLMREKSHIRRLIERDGLKCHWCRRKCNPEVNSNDPLYPTVEHLVRRVDGGSSRMPNLVVACRKCNGSRHKPGWTPMHSIVNAQPPRYYTTRFKDMPQELASSFAGMIDGLEIKWNQRKIVYKQRKDEKTLAFEKAAIGGKIRALDECLQDLSLIKSALSLIPHNEEAA